MSGQRRTDNDERTEYIVCIHNGSEWNYLSEYRIDDYATQYQDISEACDTALRLSKKGCITAIITNDPVECEDTVHLIYDGGIEYKPAS